VALPAKPGGAWRATSAKNTPFQPKATAPSAMATTAKTATGQAGVARANAAPLAPMA